MQKSLSTEEVGELVSIHLSELAVGHPLSIHSSNWRGETGTLARRGLVTWTAGKAWSPRFREVGVTQKGKGLLDRMPHVEKMAAYDACLAAAYNSKSDWYD